MIHNMAKCPQQNWHVQMKISTLPSKTIWIFVDSLETKISNKCYLKECYQIKSKLSSHSTKTRKNQDKISWTTSISIRSNTEQSQWTLWRLLKGYAYLLYIKNMKMAIVHKEMEKQALTMTNPILSVARRLWSTEFLLRPLKEKCKVAELTV